MSGVRLNLVNPNSTAAMTEKIAAAARRAAMPDTEIIARTSSSGPPSIEGYHDGAMALPGLLAEIERGEGDGASAHIIACFDDTGLDAARSAAACPVVGIGEAACLLATQLAERFVVVTAAAVSVPVLEGNLRRNGLDARCAAVKAAGLGVLDIEDQAEGAVAGAMRRAAEEFPDAAIVLGCAGMASLAARLAEELDRPVIDGVAAAIVLAEGLVRLAHAPVKTGGWAPPRWPG